jgi:bifunctional N-acetylglucosamine-1-phosphate-uridyltransferase/glucosamine-1-phosphate-acetyltransferase GlmU-like protein
MLSRTLVLVLAAGRGTRMGSALPKPLVTLAGKPLIGWLLEAVNDGVARIPGLDADVAVVVGRNDEAMRSALGPRFGYLLQDRPLGTGHAALQALPILPGYAHALVLVGDSALIRAETVARLIEEHLEGGADCTFLTAEFPDDYPYARVLREPDGRVIGCVESDEISAEQSSFTELFTSHYAFRSGPLAEYLPRLRPRGPKGEVQLTEIIGLLARSGHTLEAIRVADHRELVGLNTPEELAWAENVLEDRRGTGS